MIPRQVLSWQARKSCHERDPLFGDQDAQVAELTGNLRGRYPCRLQLRTVNLFVCSNGVV